MNEPQYSEKDFSSVQATLPESQQYSYAFWLVILLALFFIVYLIFYFHHKPPRVKKAPAVVLTSVESKNVPVYVSGLGNVVPVYTITLHTQINGLLMKVHYKEGQIVKQGELLAEIDQRPLLAQLKEYQGQLIRDKALLANALIDLKRYQRLWQQDSVSQQTLATQESLVRQYQGTVEIDEGLIEITKVNLLYCHITSPVDGRIGLRLVDPGNFVQTTDTTGLAVITTLAPITVIFTIPEDDIPKVLPLVMTKEQLKIEAYDRQQNALLATGTLIAMDNQVNTSTGTVRLRASFTNQENKLFSNQFVNIKMLVDELKNAKVVATAAVQHGRVGDFVYLLNPENNTVSIKTVKVGVTSHDETVILSGLEVGQKVVVDGVDKISNGVKVRIAH